MFENEHFLIVDKRAGFLTVPSRMGKKDPRPCELLDWMEQKKIRLWAVHRLDQEVSGMLIFAKNAEAHRVANDWFEKRQIEKTYQALSCPVRNPAEHSRKFIWKSKLLRGKKRAYEREFGKDSVTEAQFERNTELNHRIWSLWNLVPRTGRSHQLRYEMAKHEYPILGDSLYGSNEKWDLSGAIALRSVKLDFSKCENRERFGVPIEVTGPNLEAWIRTSTK